MMEDPDKPFLEHLNDLRNLIIKSCLILAVTITLSCVYSQKIMALLRAPLDQTLTSHDLSPEAFLITLGITDPLTMMIEMGIFSGIIIASPILFYLIGGYLLPALTPRERKLILPTFFIGAVLFISGILFCYFLVLPQALNFFFELNSWFGWQAQWTIRNYLSFILQMLIAFGVSFELPLVIFILSRIGLITARTLTKYRRHTIVILVIFAACITPTSDPYNLALLFVPMYFLFELSILAVFISERRSKG